MDFAAVQKQETDSLTILQRIAKNDSIAVKDCVDAYGDLVWTIAKEFTDSEQAAEDAAQEIFTDIWRYAGRYDSKKVAENIYIGLIARRRLIKCADTVKKSDYEQGKVRTNKGKITNNGKLPSNEILKIISVFRPPADTQRRKL